ncbi:exocyst complex component sec10 [Artemisia annua]|uniref:Exocyst complex component sec10 n=1 Tax=Artemisia annua TaxID=35608 RepID=A0A2U1Q631_ARTAN|nr:exocyst complex component sec10 [Artemisia annua]
MGVNGAEGGGKRWGRQWRMIGKTMERTVEIGGDLGGRRNCYKANNQNQTISTGTGTATAIPQPFKLGTEPFSSHLAVTRQIKYSKTKGQNMHQTHKQLYIDGNFDRLHKRLSNHSQKHTFNPSEGLRLKSDITEYGNFVRSFNAPTVDEKFESLSIMANVFIITPEILSSLFEVTPTILKATQSLISLERITKVRTCSSLSRSG